MAAPTGQALALAQYIKHIKVMTGDPMAAMWQPAELDKFVTWHKKMVGGSWMRVVQDPSSGEWVVDRGVKNVRFDATSDSQFQHDRLHHGAPR